MSDPKNISGFRRAFRHRDYTIYTAGNLCSLIADWANRIAIGWLVWQLTESPAWLGVISFSDMAPTVLLSPIAGAFADRFDRLKVCVTTSAISTVAALVLMTLYGADLLSIWVLLAVVLGNGIGSALGQPARLAIIPSLIPRQDLGPAIAINSVTFNMSRFAGPMIAGLILYYVGTGWVFLISAIFQATFLSVLWRLTLPPTEPRASRGSLIGDIVDGVRYTARHPGIGPLMFLLVVSSVGTRPFLDLLPGFAASVFDRGPEALATMTSTVGLGALLGGIYLSTRASIVGLTVIAVSAVLVIGLGLTAFALMDHFWSAVVCLFIVGIGLSTSATGIMTLVQAAVDTSMRGRVLSLYGLIFRGGPAIGSLTMGWAAQFVGLRWPVAIGAMICIVLWAWTMRKVRGVARAVESEGFHG